MCTPIPRDLSPCSVCRVAQKKHTRNSQFFWTLLWSTVIFSPLLDRASFLHYNNTKIIKFGWELFILWVISCGLSFWGFARFSEFRGTINDSFVLCSVIRVLPNKDHYRVQWQWFTIQARHWHWDFFVAGWCWYVLAHVLLKLSLIVSRNSGNRANPENDSP